jgi:putative ABC transport system permease protein
MEILLQDLRYSLRMLVKSPGFTVVAVIALTLGIGANTAIFSVINAVLLRPLPFDEPERLVNVWETRPQRGIKQNVVAYPNFADWRDQNDVFDRIAASYISDFTLTGDDNPERLQCGIVSSDLFPLLGAQPLVGRVFLPEDDKSGAPLTVILGYDLWKQRYNSDPGIIDSSITLNNTAYTVIGVMPENFQFPVRNDPVDLWTTFAKDLTPVAGKSIAERRVEHFLRVIARLKPGVTIQQAQTTMETIAARLSEKYPDTNANWGVSVSPALEDLVGKVRATLLILMGAVGCVLLIACANVSSLLLARATTRHKEMAIRAALGASRLRVIRQLLTESAVLAIVGGLLGLVVALWGTSELVALSGEGLPRAGQIGIDMRVLGFTMLLAIFTSVLFGLVPAIHSSKTDLNEALKEGGRGSSDGARRNRLRSVLVTAEVAIAVVLLVGAGLLLQSLWRLQRVDTGLNHNNVMTAEIGLPLVKYKTQQQGDFYHRLRERLVSLPGVESASAVYPLPLKTSRISIAFEIEGRPVPRSERPSADFRVVSLDYFRTMGIQLVNGRDFNERDHYNAPGVVIINELFAERFFPGEDPISKRILPGISFEPGKAPALREIVGVVRNVKHLGLNKDFTPEYYVLHEQMPYNYMVLVVKTAGDPNSLVGAVRDEVGSMDKDLPLYNIRTMDEYLSLSITQPRLIAMLLAIFAGLALALTAIGLYGVVSYYVAQRTHEIGVRMALGAKPADVLRLVVMQSMTLAVAGVIIGLAGTFILTRVLASIISDLLFGIGASDPLTFLVIALIIIGVALAACFVPARRATEVDPMVALRYE